MNTPENPHHRSLFWPIVLIGIGVILLLANLNIITTANLTALLALWPLLLVALGLEIMIGRRSTLASGLVGVLMVAAVILILIFGPQLGLNLPSGQLTQERYTEPIGPAQRASVLIDVSSDPVTIDSFAGPNDLISADVTTVGAMEFTASGSSDKNIVLRKLPNTINFNFGLITQPTRWKVSLNPEIPLDLTLEGGSGSTNADLSLLQLERLRVNVASGSFRADLPESEQAYEAEFEGGSGSLTVYLPPATDLTFSVDGGSGSIHILLPPGVEYRVEVRDSGSGSMNLPRGLQQVERGDGDEGIWESSGYAGATHRLHIIIEDIGSGSVSID